VGEILSDELIELDGTIVDKHDHEERILELLKSKGIEAEEGEYNLLLFQLPRSFPN